MSAKENNGEALNINISCGAKKQEEEVRQRLREFSSKIDVMVDKTHRAQYSNTLCQEIDKFEKELDVLYI